MSQIKSDKLLQIDIKFSLQHKIYLIVIHFLAAILLFLPFELHFSIKFLLACYIVVSFYYLLRKTKKHYSGVLHYISENHWQWINNGHRNNIKLQHGYILFPRFLLMVFINKAGKRNTLLFFPDSLDRETFRKIRVLLRHSTADTTSSPA